MAVDALMGLGTLIVMPFIWIFGPILSSGKKFIRNMARKTFPTDSMPPNASQWTIVFTSFVAIGDAIRDIIQQLGIVIPAFFALAPFLIPAAIGLFFFLSYVMLLAPLIIKFIDIFVTIPIALLRIVIVAYNSIIRSILITLAPPWNLILKWIGHALVLLFHFLFPGPVTFPLDLSFINDIIQFILTWASFIGEILKVYFDAIVSIYTLIGNILCPGNVCLPDLCTLINVPNCGYGVELFFTWLITQISTVFTTLFPIIPILKAFLMDLFGMILTALQLFVSLPGTVNGTGVVAALANILSNVSGFLSSIVGGSTTNLFNLVVASEYIFLKNLGLFIEEIIRALNTFFLDIIVGLFILLDNVICNVFTDFTSCFAGKLCYFIFKTPLVIPIILVVVDFNALICVPLGMIPANCFYCDACVYTNPYNLFLTGLYSYVMPALTATQILVPCAFNCVVHTSLVYVCDAQHSILPKILAF
jgi:hypothetical protein